MKKFLSMMLALVLVLSMSTVAFAAKSDSSTDTAYTDATTVTVKKSYKLTNADTTSPAETFTLVQVGDGVVIDGDAASAPTLGTITGAQFTAGAATANGTEGTISIQLPTYSVVGVYEYTLKETAGTTAGVTYYSSNIKLIVTVVNGEDGNVRVAAVHTEAAGADGKYNPTTKSDTFENTYSAGTLKVSKTVTGNLGDKSKYFEFKVTLTGENGKTYGDSYTVSGGSNTGNPTSIKIGEETTFYLKDDETISIANLPYGVTYTVTETSYENDGYTTTKTGDTGSINGAEQTAAFTNNKGAEVDTGITMDSMPYILLLAVAFVGLFVFFSKKRMMRNF